MLVLIVIFNETSLLTDLARLGLDLEVLVPKKPVLPFGSMSRLFVKDYIVKHIYFLATDNRSVDQPTMDADVEMETTVVETGDKASDTGSVKSFLLPDNTYSN